MNRRDALRTLGAAAGITGLLTLTPQVAEGIESSLARRLAGQPPAPTGPLGPFTARQNETVLAAAEHILPRTDTPGARDARVNEFIAVIVDEWYAEEDKTRFLAGLADLDGRTRARYRTDFLSASGSQQLTILQALDEETSARRQAGQSTSGLFWPMMKSLTLYGYFTSRLVMTDVLKTPIIPGRFDGCVTADGR
ncbi:MAG: gluconate 2-dehydrogenase subunit 3 family protein [Gemmatimonadales bacterium]